MDANGESKPTGPPARAGKFSGNWGRRRGGGVGSDSSADLERFSGKDTLGITGVRHHKLGEWGATAICGNDISSSCLYVAGLATAYAGYLAPFALLTVAAVLFLFRYIYAEVGDALPLNGGAYNCLLNTTTKFKASIAACLTILSYVATAVISAAAAMGYLEVVLKKVGWLENVSHHAPTLFTFVNIAAVVVLLAFAVLAIIGITESAKVALGIFIFHLGTLVLLCGIALYVFFQDTSILAANWGVLPTQDGQAISFSKALFLGFAAALLGISGFESSANFIEEQQAGVFAKTLRNMWLVVSIFNPLTAFLVLAILPGVVPELGAMASGGHGMPVLTMIAEKVGGNWLIYVVGIDAVLVLCGAVLTSFVGVGGLVERMTLDRCLPQALIKKNVWRGTNHRIYIVFFVICVSIIAATGGAIATLAGVYTISFLGVMALFAIGNMLLKVKRDKLKRTVRAPWLFAIIALAATLVGMVGNVVLDPNNFKWFLIYFIPTVSIVGVMFLRISILKGVLTAVDGVMEKISAVSKATTDSIEKWIAKINSQRIVFFTKGDNVSNLNRAILYVLDNEPTKRREAQGRRRLSRRGLPAGRHRAAPAAGRVHARHH
ncbi:MAG: APC family permease [Planctomycetota bacterium]